MEGVNDVKRKRENTWPPRGVALRSIHSHVHSHPFEVRRKAVQLCLEESFPLERVAREMGVGRSTLSKWVRLYRDHGEASLKSQQAGPSRPRPPGACENQIVPAQQGCSKKEVGTLFHVLLYSSGNFFATLEPALELRAYP